MTREEAIVDIRDNIKPVVGGKSLDMAIKALEQEPCGDAISREELIEALDTWDKFGYAPTNELIPLRGNVDKDKYVPYIHYDDVIECIKGMPSVTPQQRTGQRTGRWERMSDLPNDVDDRFECSRCGNIVHHRSVMDLRTFSRWCGRCGSENDYKMEVEE